ncbi:ATP synthase subunit alpha [Podospora australis]|uniref:ATP synthase subunit alpha n=1 Tax=Podospora australis TaxID=1536484 RepID=A0AAN6WI73_9PEZI|nr:ATP synthase subunit alpha [Podospora australis]
MVPTAICETFLGIHNKPLPRTLQIMTGPDMAHSSIPRLDDADPFPPGEMRPNNEPDDDAIVLAPDQATQVNRFREELRICETDAQRYEMCVQKRDELLDRHTGLQVLVAACDHVMSVECPEYRRRKQTKNRDSTQPLPANQEDDAAQWNRFFGVATDGFKHLSALKEVVRCWGRDIVQHYQWASKGEKYCNQLRTTARRVPVWKEAVIGLNWSMLQRSRDFRRRPVKALVNPIEQADLDSLRTWSREHPFPCQKLAAEDLSDAFGFDKYGLMVHKEFAVDLPEFDGAGTTEAPALSEASSADVAEPSRQNDPMALDILALAASQPSHTDANTDDIVAEAADAFLAETVDATTLAGHDQSSTTSAEDTAATTPEVPHFLDSAGNTNTAPEKPIEILLRARKELSYREPSRRERKSKPKQAHLASVKAPKIPPRCCSAEVPSTLLLVLDNPSMFGPEAAKQFSPFLTQLCRPHLQLLATRTSAIALTQKSTLMGNQDILSAATSFSADRPVRRRAASLPDITQSVSKRPRLDVPPTFLPTPMARPDVARDRPMHDRMADDTYRKRVLAELREKSSQHAPPRDSHGKDTDELIRQLLEKVEQPNTDSSQGAVEALLCTGDEAASLAESGSSHDAPIITEGQQQFRWSKGDRPIVQLFRRMGFLDKSVSVQIPSRSSTTQSYEVRKLGEVRKRFLKQDVTDDPWNILDLQSPLPQSMPNFLTGENCQLLLQVRNAVLMEESAERVVASTQAWNEWKNVLDWVLLSEGGHNTAPHMDSHGFATWITAQEGSIGFGWMSCPTGEERKSWTADPHHYTDGRWRYIILKPGQSVFFMPGTIHFVFRVREHQTLALGGHILQWSDIRRWMQVVLVQTKNSVITNEDMRRSAPKLVHVVAKLVKARVEESEVEQLGGEAAVTQFFASVKVSLSRTFETKG